MQLSLSELVLNTLQNSWQPWMPIADPDFVQTFSDSQAASMQSSDGQIGGCDWTVKNSQMAPQGLTS